MSGSRICYGGLITSGLDFDTQSYGRRLQELLMGNESLLYPTTVYQAFRT
jgi:hypothetical protein